MLSEKPRSGLSETRKMTKSTMEKRRRQRINNSLTELKSILSGMITHKGERFDKMEKADILEMTVKCVRQLQKQANSADGSRSPSNVPDEDYKSGMHKCMSEVIKFISSSSFSDADPAVKTKLLDHLANKLSDSTVKSTQDTSYSRHSFSSDDSNMCCSKLTDDFSDTDNDANNNVNSISGPDAVFSPPTQQQTSESVSPMFTSGKPVIPEPETCAQQPVQQTNMPTVPLTILLPANFCSTAIGTTCVIPLNLPGVSPQQLNQSGFMPSVSVSGLSTSGHMTFPSASGIPLISNQNALFATNQTVAVGSYGNQDNNRTITFSPTVITDNINKTNHVIPCTTSFPTATITHAQQLPPNSPESSSKDNTTLANTYTLSNVDIKKSQSPLQMLSIYENESCSQNTDMRQPPYRVMADSTTTSSAQDRARIPIPSGTRDIDTTGCCTQDMYTPALNLSPPRNQNTQRHMPYPAASNAQHLHNSASNSHWRPW